MKTFTDEQARSFLGERLRRFFPVLSDRSMDSRDFIADHKHPMIFKDESVMEALEQHRRHLYCRVCIRTDQNDMVWANRLYVTTERDELGNYTNGLLSLDCQNCDFRMFTALPSQIYSEELDPIFWDELLKVVERLRQKGHAPGDLLRKMHSGIDELSQEQAKREIMERMRMSGMGMAPPQQPPSPYGGGYGLGYGQLMEENQRHISELMRQSIDQNMLKYPPVSPSITATSIRESLFGKRPKPTPNPKKKK